MPKSIAMCNVNLPHITVRKNGKGEDRYYFRRKGFPISRLPSPTSSRFRGEYEAKLAASNGIDMSKSDRAQAGYREYWAANMLRCAQKRVNRSCHLTRKDIVEMMRRQEDRCAISGMRFHYRRDDERLDPYSPSLDRIDSSLDYTPENCRVVLLAVNYGLNKWGDDTFKRICRAVARQRPVAPPRHV